MFNRGEQREQAPGAAGSHGDEVGVGGREGEEFTKIHSGGACCDKAASPNHAHMNLAPPVKEKRKRKLS